MGASWRPRHLLCTWQTSLIFLRWPAESVQGRAPMKAIGGTSSDVIIFQDYKNIILHMRGSTSVLRSRTLLSIQFNATLIYNVISRPYPSPLRGKQMGSPLHMRTKRLWRTYKSFFHNAHHWPKITHLPKTGGKARGHKIHLTVYGGL